MIDYQFSLVSPKLFTCISQNIYLENYFKITLKFICHFQKRNRPLIPYILYYQTLIISYFITDMNFNIKKKTRILLTSILYFPFKYFINAWTNLNVYFSKNIYKVIIDFERGNN